MRSPFFADLPLAQQDQDGLGFSSYARAIVTAVRDTNGPLTIGIFGEWGTGKTSLMQLVQDALKGDDKIFPIWFNAWQYEQEEHPLVPLIGTILNQLQGPGDSGESTFENSLGPEKSKTFFQSLRALASRHSFKIKAKLPWGVELECAPNFQGGDETAAGPSGAGSDGESHLSRLLDQSIYYQTLEALAGINLGADLKVVVFIDDLDRCFPDKAIKLLETIKLILSQAGFIFVLGVSRSVIEGYLKHRYVKRYGLEEFHAKKYLEKIVQLPFDLTPIREPGRIKTFFEVLFRSHRGEKSHLGEIAATCKESAALLNAIGAIQDFNPRGIIRFINSLLIGKIIFAAQVETGLIPEVIPLGSFIVDKTLREGWSTAYFVLNDSEALCKLIQQEKSDTITVAAPSDKDLVVINEFNNNEAFRKLLQSPIGQKWLEGQQGRESLQKFSRSLSVGPADLFLDIKTWRAPKHDVRFPGLKIYRWDATIQGRDEALNAIESVTYRLHSSYPNPVQVITDRGTKFKLKELAWGSSTLNADVKVRHQDDIISLSGFINLTPEASGPTTEEHPRKDL